jgi:hypothetical protein
MDLTGLQEEEEEEEEGAIDDGAGGSAAAAAAGPIPRSQSSASLFSLATHRSVGSGASEVPLRREVGGGAPATPIRLRGRVPGLGQDACALRLFHAPSDTVITERNHQTYIAHGRMYDEVAKLCMEHAQRLMMAEGNLEWTTICAGGGGGDVSDDIRALVSKNSARWRDSCSDSGKEKKRRKTLLVITGTGQVGAGIFSRRLLLTTGIEPATALPFVREATLRKGMDVVVLDPNCKGKQRAMEVVETSLERLFFGDERDGDDDDDDEIYVLAHSMAGSQLVRFLLHKATAASAAAAAGGDDSGDKRPDDVIDTYLRRIKAVAFTDSNHNINWVKKFPALTSFIEGPRCLYIKSHKVHEDAKALGQVHHNCQYWRRRFGSVRTLWAGTNEHALTNHTARFHIWDHFDSFNSNASDSY